MSDALTDIRRDDQRGRVLKKIDNAENEFLENPSKDKAENLIRLWDEYLSIKRGYWGSPNKSIAYEQIGLLKRYLKAGEIVGMKRQRIKTDSDELDKVISIGEGFIAEGNVEGWVMGELWNAFGNPNHKNFKINLKIEGMEEVSCRDCPYLNSYCGSNYGCRSKNLDELAERRKIIKEGMDG
jgi:hypothetical protein